MNKNIISVMDKTGLFVLGLMLLGVNASAQVPDTINIENSNVRAYINDNEYTRESNKSVIRKYLDGLGERRLDQANALHITLPAAAEEEGKFYYSTSEDFSDAIVLDIKKGDTECEAGNLVPQTTVYTKAVINGETVVEGKTFIDGHVRMMNLESVLNMRDMGGWMTSSGKRIQYGLLYRGSAIDFQVGHFISREDIDEMKRLGVGADLDLRDSHESYETESALGSSVAYQFVGHSASDYTSLRTDASKWKKDFEFIVKNLREGKSVYQHCILGADRTGLMSFIIGGILGMDIDALFKDYELTSMTASNYLREWPRINLCVEYINTRPGNTFQDRFEYYFINDLRVNAKYVRDFRKIMLDGYDSYYQTIGIDDVETDESVNDDIFYDLSGRVVKNPSKGIYIKNGKKYIMN